MNAFLSIHFLQITAKHNRLELTQAYTASFQYILLCIHPCATHYIFTPPPSSQHPPHSSLCHPSILPALLALYLPSIHCSLSMPTIYTFLTRSMPSIPPASRHTSPFLCHLYQHPLHSPPFLCHPSPLHHIPLGATQHCKVILTLPPVQPEWNPATVAK